MSGKRLKVKVISKVGDKTVMGLHTFLKEHPLYKKYVKRQKKYMIHDESNNVAVGDEIVISESRPISKRKTWVVITTEEGNG